MFADTSIDQINSILQQSWKAFHEYRNYSLKQRAGFMRAIAVGLEASTRSLLQTATEETHLTEPRLQSELIRTIFQLTSYADACERGDWLEARIDTADPSKDPSTPDIRKMLVPIGPVVVFGASNFPFAYSTPGGDTACAFAAGCPVIVKAHPAHAQTSELVAQVIFNAAARSGMPSGIFAHVHGAGFETGQALVTHPLTKAVGFTGSYNGGKALFDWAAQRPVPIPVFAEMGSVNPVFLFPDKLEQEGDHFAELYADSITQSVGQFCTNPGLIIGLESPSMQRFIDQLGARIAEIAPATMLHPGIAKAFIEKRTAALQQPGVQLAGESHIAPRKDQGIPTIATTTGEIFLSDPLLHQEVFGPYSLVIRCRNIEEMFTVATHLEGQLTASLIATENDIRNHLPLVEAIKNTCGRLIMNGVPTGVTVCLSMQHGGPFPATTDVRLTSVGADGIKRFARPVAFQNWPDALLPDELKYANPLNIYRTVNNELTKAPI